MKAWRRGAATLAASRQPWYYLSAWSTCGAIWILALAPSLAAQRTSLESRLDPLTAAEVSRLMDSTRAGGLPTEPLLDKALEGASKHANSQQIVTAVRGLAVRLHEARAALGPTASQSDLVAAAGALYQGVAATELTRLHEARGDQPVALPLVVLADLIARGVPTSTAMSVVMEVATRGAGDDAFTALRRDVESDIAAGAPPAIA
ncbi:MAG TPA: hypothetical protein VIQ60_03930, partial [Gemmatimonadaceae bacterium]